VLTYNKKRTWLKVSLREVLTTLLGIRLKELRIEKKMTQSELGSRVNVTKSSISGYENGTRTPDTDTLLSLANALKISVDYLLGRTNYREPAKESTNRLETLNEINLLLEKYDIEESGFFDVNSWKIMNEEDLKELENHFKYITSKAKDREDQSN